MRAILRVYLRGYHKLSYRWPETLPSRGPYIAMTSHFSILDTVTLMVVDPYRPYTTFVVKRSMMDVPIIGVVLRAWGVISVDRDRRDLQAVRSITQVLREGRGICIAAEGTRSRTGRLGPMNAALTKIALRAALDGVPVFPVVELGTYEALPPGALIPRPAKIACHAGDPIDFNRFKGRTDEAAIAEAAALIQASIAALLPPARRPAPGTPAISPV